MLRAVPRLAAVVIALQACGCVHWLWESKSRATEIVFTTTKDGWPLALHHYPPAEGVRRRAFPVIVCHGMASNRANWDLTGRFSFPLYLASQGYDTWAVELRASGESPEPGLFDDRTWEVSFDDYVLHDAPALVDYVRAQTGAEQVHWVGHSMGGAVLYGYLERVGGEAIRTGVTVASPIYVLDHNRYVNRSSWQLPVLGLLLDHVDSATWTKLFSPLAPYAFLDETRIVWNHDNMDAEVARAAAASAINDVSITLLEQFTKSQANGALRSVDGTWDYTGALGSIETPMLVLGGVLDQLAPPAVVGFAYSRLGSTDKEIEIYSRANGHASDYGHVDLVIGRDAPREVYPRIARWLDAHEP